MALIKGSNTKIYNLNYCFCFYSILSKYAVSPALTLEINMKTSITVLDSVKLCIITSGLASAKKTLKNLIEMYQIYQTANCWYHFEDGLHCLFTCRNCANIRNNMYFYTHEYNPKTVLYSSSSFSFAIKM